MDNLNATKLHKLPDRVIRKRKRLFTLDELAAILDVHPSTVHRLEHNAISPLLVKYLNAVRYRINLSPVRKRTKRAAITHDY